MQVSYTRNLASGKFLELRSCNKFVSKKLDKCSVLVRTVF